MNFETKMMRSLKKGKKFVRSMNSGAFKELTVHFGFSIDGVRENYRLCIVHSPEVFSLFGYGTSKNETRLWKQDTSYSAHGVELFENEAFKAEVEMLRKELEESFTHEEMKQTLHDYTEAAKQFSRDMGWVA